MTRTITVLLALAAAVLLGCMPSLHPLYLPENLVSLKGIEGRWENDSSEIGDETWEFSRRDSLGYNLTYTENGEAGEFDARIVKLDNLLFIDMAPNPPETDNDVYKGLLLPMHMFGRIWLEGDSLRIGWLDGDWLYDKVEKGEVNLALESGENDQVLVASTQDLQAFAIKYADDPEAFPSETLTRAVR
jgi:hypothetical protein